MARIPFWQGYVLMPPIGSSGNVLRGGGSTFFDPPLYDVSYAFSTGSDGTQNSWGVIDVEFNFSGGARPYLLSCWMKRPETSFNGDPTPNKPCNMALVENNNSSPAGYQSVRAYTYPEYLSLDVYYAGGQKTATIPTTHGADEHDWYHVVYWMINGDTTYFAVNGSWWSNPISNYPGPWEACSSEQGRKKIGRFTYNGGEYAPQSWNGYMTRWFMVSQTDWDNCNGKYYTSTGDRHRDLMNLMGYWDNGFWVPSDISTLGADYGTPKDQFLRDVGNVEHAMYIPFDGTSA